MSQVKMVVVGLNRGGILAKHILNFGKKATLYGVCDIDKEKVDKFAKENGVERVFYDLEDVLSSDADAVILATPIPDHAKQAVRVLNSGKHLLSEVITATTLDDCIKIKEAIEKSGKKYMMEENYCYYRPLTIVENMIKAGLFGDIYYAESDYLMDFQQRKGFPEGIEGWRKDVYFGRKGHPYITHTLGPLANIMGENITSVSCMGSGEIEGLTADRTCTLICRTEKGNTIRLRNSFVSTRPDLYTYYSIQGTKGCYQGPQGPTDYHKVHIRGLCKPGEWKNLFDFKGLLPSSWNIFPEGHFDEMDKFDDGVSQYDTGGPVLIEAFADCILKDTEPPISFEKAVNWTLTGIMSEESALKNGMPIQIPKL